jgi:hypothetical protein
VQDLAGVTSVSARLEAVLTRLAGRFRSMPESKLLTRLPDGRTRAAAGYELAGLVALAAQGVEEHGGDVAPGWRRLPFDGPFVVGDQIGVTGHDLLAACARAGRGSWNAGRGGDAEIGGDGEVGGDTEMGGAAEIAGGVEMGGPAEIGGDVEIGGGAVVVWGPPGSAVAGRAVRIEVVLESVLRVAEGLAKAL